MYKWHDVLNIALSARWPEKGKPIDNNTRMILDGPRDNPTLVRLKFHATNIAVWYPGGEMFVCTGWESMTTRDRLSNYASVQVFTADLPAINGYAVHPSKATFARIGANDPVPFNGSATCCGTYSNYIRVNSDGEIDMSTVKPIEVQCVVEPEKLRKCMRHLGKVANLALGYIKLSDNDAVFHNGTVQPYEWLLQRRNIPLEDIQLSPFPQLYSRITNKQQLKQALNAVRWTIAKEEGWVGNASLLHRR